LTRISIWLSTCGHERFTHNLTFVNGLLKFYARTTIAALARLVADYFACAIFAISFWRTWPAVEMRAHFDRARETPATVRRRSSFASLLPYTLFRADGRLASNYEEAVAAYRELNSYIQHAGIRGALDCFTLFGQHNHQLWKSPPRLRTSRPMLSFVAEYRTRPRDTG